MYMCGSEVVLVDVLKKVRNLKYEESPNYVYIKKLLCELNQCSVVYIFVFLVEKKVI